MKPGFGEGVVMGVSSMGAHMLYADMMAYKVVPEDLPEIHIFP